MTRIGIAGDWHGNERWAKSVLTVFASQGITTVYQLGDFGIWPGADGKAYLEEIVGTCEELGITLWITPGNHDDYSQIEDPEGTTPDKQTLASGDGWEVALLPRGYFWKLDGKFFVSFGGAPSIDRQRRKEGVDWWPEEMIRESDLDRLIGFTGVDVMLAHDAPWGGTAAVQAILETPPHLSSWTDYGLAYAAEGRKLMDQAVELIDPRWFLHGHYHVADYHYDFVDDRHYVSMDSDGLPNNAGILYWNELENEETEQDMLFEFFGGDSWV